MSKRSNIKVHNASFRDPSGYIYYDENGSLMRKINDSGLEDFRFLVDSGLYERLVNKSLLIPHKEVKQLNRVKISNSTISIKPEKVSTVSYPFEWSFSQLKDAALCTLKIQKYALRYGQTLKDASAYNIQFHNGKPLLIDTLSFEKYKNTEPWKAYKQFCQHFLAPLALMSYTDVNLSQLMRIYIDGIPLEIAAKLLPVRAKARLGILLHISAHSRAQKAKSGVGQKQSARVTKSGMLAIIDSLERTINKLKLSKSNTEWMNYYGNTNYSADATDKKLDLVVKFVSSLKAKKVLDLGGNNGKYSRELNKLGIETICTDIDPNAVEFNYKSLKHSGETLMLPLVIDLVNPAGGLGWANTERSVITERFACDASMALALVHHLAISNNLPLLRIAEYFAEFSPHLIIEFVPKEDSQVKKLLSTREDIFTEYNIEGFESAFSKVYTTIDKKKIPGTKRTLYLFKRK